MPNIALLCGSFHKKEIETMVVAARAQAAEDGLTVVEEMWVPGSMEKPLALDWLLQDDKIDGVVILGIIERGSTMHGEVMGHVSTSAYIDLSIKYQKPIGQGIVGPGALPEHIPTRIEPYAKAAVKALARMLTLKQERGV